MRNYGQLLYNIVFKWKITFCEHKNYKDVKWYFRECADCGAGLGDTPSNPNGVFMVVKDENGEVEDWKEKWEKKVAESNKKDNTAIM